MTIKDCPKCGGDHWGQHECPFILASCVVCGDQTIFACSDCAIEAGGAASVHVCKKMECRDIHEVERHTLDGAVNGGP
jgi:hypothetical protein